MNEWFAWFVSAWHDSTWVTAFFAIAITLVTAWYAWVTHRMLVEMQEQRRASRHITLVPAPTSKTDILRVMNLGPGAAKEIELSVFYSNGEVIDASLFGIPAGEAQTALRQPSTRHAARHQAFARVPAEHVEEFVVIEIEAKTADGKLVRDGPYLFERGSGLRVRSFGRD